MSEKTVVLTVTDGIAEIRLNRPKVLNAISSEEARRWTTATSAISWSR